MVIAAIGATGLYLLFIWLASAIAASYLSGRKGYGERIGLAMGLVLPIISVVAWLVWPAREGSDWKVIGPFGRQRITELHDPQAGRDPAGGPGPTGVAG